MDAAAVMKEDVGRAAWPDMWGVDEKGAYFIAGRCARCRGLALGLREVCPHCLASGTIKEERIGREGMLYTATVVHQLPHGFPTSYRIGYVDVGEGIRVFSHIDDGEGAPRIGDSVKLAIRPLKTADDGSLLNGPVFSVPHGGA